MDKLKLYFKKLFALLRVHPRVGGMEISDTSLRFAYSDGKSWHLDGMRLEPGILEAGKIKDRARFIETLRALKIKVFGPGYAKKTVNIIASLGSVNIYSQVFSLPIIEGANLEKAIQLNIQMISPIDISQAYSGWQMVNKDQRSLRLEILSAFIDRATVDDMDKSLIEAGFLVAAIEPRALSITRIFNELGDGFDRTHTYILINLNDSGIDFLIIRGEQLYFEYFNTWKDIADEKGNIPLAAFEAVIIRSLHQVINFHGQHWPETINEVVLLSAVLTAEMEKIIKDNFPVNVAQLRLRGIGKIGPEWFAVMGCGIRGIKSLGKDLEMSLLGIGAQDEFRREQVINFLKFWRILMPIGLGILLVAFALADLLLGKIETDLAGQAPFVLHPEQMQEMRLLQSEAQKFNRLVDFSSQIEKGIVRRSAVWEKLYGIMSQHGITLTNFSFDSFGSTAYLNGSAPTTAEIIAFKNAIAAANYQKVDLPVSLIKNGPSGFSFSMSFVIPQ